MDLVIVAVGRCREPAILALVEEYRRRCAWPIAVREVVAKSGLSGAKLVEAEAGLLLGAVPEGAALVALDPRGEDLTSEAFAARLGRWRDEGTRAAAFAVGGADGLGAAVTARAGLRLALGRMTWPHLLVRAMLAEQLYRATAILAGHPYHRG